MAYAVTPEVTNQFGERELVFRGRVLTQEIAERLRVMGMKMVFQPPAAILLLREEARFSWSAVLASMSQMGREVAIQYFRGNDTLSGVYIRQTKPTIRKRDAKKSGD